MICRSGCSKAQFILFVEVRYKGVINHHELWVPELVCEIERLMLTEGDTSPLLALPVKDLEPAPHTGFTTGHGKVLAKWNCELR